MVDNALGTAREYLWHVVGSLILIAISVAVAVNIMGRRWRRHAVWMERIELRVGNLHKAREEAYIRSLQVPREQVSPMATARPPTLSGADTVEVSPDMLKTLTAQTRPRPPE